MISHFDRFRSSSAGLTLFETLLTLSIAALVLSVLVTTLRPTPPRLALEKEIAELQKRIVLQRHNAILSQSTRIWEIGDLSCDRTTLSISFFADGSLVAPSICLKEENLATKLSISPFTGRLQILED